MFRLRITILSVILSGVVLVSIGFLFLSLASKMNLDRIDREIQALGESQLVVLHPREHWAHFESSLRSIYGKKMSTN